MRAVEILRHLVKMEFLMIIEINDSGLSLALVHNHVKMSVGKWIMEITHSNKHVQIPEDQIFFGLTLLAVIIFQLDKYPKMFTI